MVFSDSYEFMFEDVQEGDVLRFDRHEKASRRSEEDVPATFPLTREVLTRTHGVPVLKKDDNDKSSAGTVFWRLEVPGMLINHSCNPTVMDDCHDCAKGEAFAARDIQRGEELTYDYTFQYYDKGPFFEKCLCGAANCRGSMMGFKGLSEDDKKKVLPFASEAVKAMYEEEFCDGPKVKKEQTVFPPREAVENSTGAEALRLVVPGPSYANAEVLLNRMEETGGISLFAAKDFEEGEQVYEFWTQCWPKGGSTLIDMVFSTHLEQGDLPEGTVVRVDPMECARLDRQGRLIFSGFDLFTTHSCDPNLVYNDKDEDEDDDWRGAYAARPIRKGEQLSVDFNTIFWDRTEWQGLGDGVCTCGSKKCRGTVKGFQFLSREDQEELKNLNWKRDDPPHDKSSRRVTPGEALVPHVRASWRKHRDTTPGSVPTSSSSDESSSSSSEEEN